MSLLLISCGGGNQKEIVNDFTFKSIEDLSTIYGKPIINKALKSYEWKLDNNLKVLMFFETENMEKREILRFTNLDVDPDIFYYDLGWETPVFKSNDFYTIAEGLQGIKKAMYQKNLQTLNIELDNPNSQSFGTKKHNR